MEFSHYTLEQRNILKAFGQYMRKMYIDITANNDVSVGVYEEFAARYGLCLNFDVWLNDYHSHDIYNKHHSLFSSVMKAFSWKDPTPFNSIDELYSTESAANRMHKNPKRKAFVIELCEIEV